MRIGVMLRSIDEKQGIGIYTQNLLKELLDLDKDNEYVFFYRKKSNLGRYSNYPNVQERYVNIPTKLLWDQIAIPYLAKKEKIDLIFHTKFTIPLFTNCKTIMVLHGSGWFVRPDIYPWHDIFYIRFAMPLYCKKADMIISNSNLTTNDFINILGVDRDKIRTIHLAADDIFKPIKETTVLKEAKEKYNLPERFILTVTKYFPGKNFGNLLYAFQKCHKHVPHKLVVVGKDCHKYKDDYKIGSMGLADDIEFVGWIEQKDLVALYNLADLFVFPSLYEEFGIPLVEAMACGCPVVTSNTAAPPEIVGDAGLLINPTEPEAISEAMTKILSNEKLRQELIQKSLQRSSRFSWKECAKETLALFKSLENEVNGKKFF